MCLVFSIKRQFYLSVSLPTQFTKSRSKGTFTEVDGTWKQICQNEEPGWTNKPWPRHRKSTVSNKQEHYQYGHIKPAQTQQNVTVSLLIHPLPLPEHPEGRVGNLGSIWQVENPWRDPSAQSSSFFLPAMFHAFCPLLQPYHPTRQTTKMLKKQFPGTYSPENGLLVA